MASQWRSGAKSIKKGSVELVRGQGVHTIKKDGKEIGDFSLDDDAGNWVINWNKKKPGRGQGVHDHIDDIVAAALEEEVEIYEAKVGDTVSFHHELKAAPGTKMKKSGTVEKVQGDDVLVKVKDKYGVKRHQVKMSDLVKENFGSDFLAMARQKNPNARLVTPEQKKKEAEELAKKRAGLKPAHAAPTSNPRPLGGHDPKSNRSYSEEVESVEEATLPPHLVKLIKDKQLDKVPMKHVTPRPEKQSHTIKDATPKGYGPTKEEVEQVDEISTELKQSYLDKATAKHLKQFLGREPVRGKQELDKRRAAIQKTSKELTGKTHYQEDVEQVDELNKDTVYSYNKKSTADTEKLHKKLGEFIRSNKPAEANKTAHKLNKRVAGQERADARLNTEEAKVETAAQVTKHFEMGQSTPSGVPKWVAEPLKKKKKKVEEAGDPELMGGAVSKPTASGNNPKLADKFMKAFRKMKSPANISCKTVGMISTCEEEEKELDQLFTEAMKKKPDPSSKDSLKKGEKLSGKQEPITISPEIEKKGVA